MKKENGVLWIWFAFIAGLSAYSLSLFFGDGLTIKETGDPLLSADTIKLIAYIILGAIVLVGAVISIIMSVVYSKGDDSTKFVLGFIYLIFGSIASLLQLISAFSADPVWIPVVGLLLNLLVVGAFVMIVKDAKPVKTEN